MVKHQWTAYVKIADPYQNKFLSKIVKNIEFHNNEFYEIPRLEKIAPDKRHDDHEISITHMTWEYFEMPVVINFRPETGQDKPLRVTH